MLKSHYMPINDTLPTYPLTLWFAPYALWKWRWERQFELSFQIHESYGTMGDSDIDSMKVRCRFSKIIVSKLWRCCLTGLGRSMFALVAFVCARGRA